jgi:hypothetical protein
MLFGRVRRRRKISLALPATIVGIILVAFLVRSTLGFVVAACLLIGAVMYGRYAVLRQLSSDRQWHALENLRQLTGIEFESHVAELYRKLGYQTEMTGKTGDQGIDIIARLGQKRLGIQCKHWSDAVGNSGVQEAIAGRTFHNCTHAAVVCTSRFTSSAEELARRAKVELIDGSSYAAIVNGFTPMQKPRGVAAWVPRGSAALPQCAFLAGAIAITILHFALLGWTFPTSRLADADVHRTDAATSMSNSVSYSTASFGEAVEAFYAAINAHKYVTAYSFLSPAFRSDSSYDSWVAGYRDTIYSQVEITPTTDPSVVDVTIIADERSSDHRRTQQTVYTGEYRGAESPNGNWVIDSGYINLRKRTYRS